MINSKFIMSIKEWDDRYPPPHRFLQIVIVEGKDNPAQFRIFKSYFYEVLCMREIMIRFGRYLVFFRVTYPERLLYFIEMRRRFLWWKLQVVKEMWYRKTFRVTAEQVHYRLEEKAMKCLSTSVSSRK